MAEPPRVTVTVQSPEQIAAALAAGRRLRILAAPWMAAAYGVRGLAPPAERGACETALDCAGDAAAAMAALRAGWKLVAFSGRAGVRRKLAEIAAQMGARVVAPPAAPDIALAHGEDAAERLRAFFRAAPGAPPGENGADEQRYGADAQRNARHKGGHGA